MANDGGKGGMAGKYWEAGQLAIDFDSCFLVPEGLGDRWWSWWGKGWWLEVAGDHHSRQTLQPTIATSSNCYSPSWA